MELRKVALTLWKWAWLIVLATVVAAVSSWLVVRGEPPIYRTSTTLMVGQTIQEVSPDYSEFYTAQQLAQTYSDLIKREPILKATAAALGFEAQWRNLKGQVSAALVAGTQLMEISVIDTDPVRAKRLADEIARQLIATVQGTRPQGSAQQFIQKQVDVLPAKIEAAQEEISQLEAELGQTFSAREIQDLQSRINTLENQVNSWRSTFADYQLLLGDTGVNVLTVIEEAPLPTHPVGSQGRMQILLAAAMGLMLAVGAAFLIEYLDDTVKTPEDVERKTGMPTLGSIIRFPAANGDGPLTALEPRSAVAEGYRVLRTNLQFAAMALGKPAVVLLITSAQPSEGKTSTVANLGVSLAQAGRKVLLVDADLRRPTLHRLFNLSKEAGLTSLLLEREVDIEHVIKETRVEGLRVLPSGPVPANPAEVLGFAEMGAVLERLRTMADYVLLDAPPVLSAADTSVLAQKVDGSLLVVEAGRTRTEMFERAAAVLQRVKARVLGTILTKVGVGRSSRSYDYYYYYSGYYTEDEGGHPGKAHRTPHGLAGRLRSGVAGLGAAIGGLFGRRPVRTPEVPEIDHETHEKHEMEVVAEPDHEIHERHERSEETVKVPPAAGEVETVPEVAEAVQVPAATVEVEMMPEVAEVAAEPDHEIHERHERSEERAGVPPATVETEALPAAEVATLPAAEVEKVPEAVEELPEVLPAAEVAEVEVAPVAAEEVPSEMAEVATGVLPAAAEEEVPPAAAEPEAPPAVEEVMVGVPAGVAALEVATVTTPSGGVTTPSGGVTTPSGGAPRPLSVEVEAPPEVAELIVGVPAEVPEVDHEIHERHEMVGVPAEPDHEIHEKHEMVGVTAEPDHEMPEKHEMAEVAAEIPPATVTTPSGGAPAVEPAAAGAAVRPNVLYSRAMEHYRKREWPQAHDELLRLKAADPARPGLDGLIDDVKQFIKSDQARQRAPTPEPEAAPVTAPPAMPRKRRSRMPLWQAVALALVVLAVAGGALAFAGVLKLPGLSLPFLDNRVQTYINRGYDSFTVDDYQTAMDNFNKALELDPDNEEAKLGLQHATQYLELRILYTEARALMEQKSFAEAITRLQTIIAADPWYEDADLLLQQCENAQKLEDLYTQALSYYNAGDWAKATDAFEALQGKGVAAGEAEVRSKLFDSYLNEGRQQVAAADSRSAIIRATLSFNSALALFPDDDTAQEERRLASLYLDGYTAYERADWRQAAGYLARLCATHPDYAQGRAARVLCESYTKQGDAYQANGQLQPALDQYRLVQAVALCDQTEVSAKIQQIQALLAPTPTPATTP